MTLDSQHLFDAAVELAQAALDASRSERARSEARVGMLKSAAALREAGDEEGHDRLLAEVRRSQALDGIVMEEEADG